MEGLLNISERLWVLLVEAIMETQKPPFKFAMYLKHSPLNEKKGARVQSLSLQLFDPPRRAGAWRPPFFPQAPM